MLFSYVFRIHFIMHFLQKTTTTGVYENLAVGTRLKCHFFLFIGILSICLFSLRACNALTRFMGRGEMKFYPCDAIKVVMNN